MMLGRFSLPTTLPFEVNETPTTKLQNLCRMCATSCSNPVSLFGPEGVANELAIKFCSYLPVKVSEMDTLPLQLCYECTNLLIQWDAAVLVAIASDKKLRALQWREQFDKQRAEEKLSNESNTQRLSNSASEESLSCSVCPKSGMVFRELIEHLKSHKMPQPLSNDNSRANCNQRQSESYSSQTIVPEIGDIESHQSVNANILEPLICLETLEPKRKSNQSSSDTVSQRMSMRSKRKSLGKQDESFSENSEGGSEDGVVTSSTSGGPTVLRKSTDNIEGESRVRKESGPTQFKPKVRIISAESINQSLEERAKANQTAKSSESQITAAIKALQPPMQSVLKPLTSALSASQTVVLPGGVFKVGNVKAPTKLLKLPDGRFVRLLETKGGKVVYTSAPVQRPISSKVLNQLGGTPYINKSQDKEKSCPPDTQILPLVNIAPAPSSEKNVVPAPSSPEKDCSSDEITAPNKTVTLGDSKIITFHQQPGPKHSVTRYMCVFCKKRNLLLELLEEHARSHSTDNLTNVSPLSDKSN